MSLEARSWARLCLLPPGLCPRSSMPDIEGPEGIEPEVEMARRLSGRIQNDVQG
jgi:hypothetical protein